MSAETPVQEISAVASTTTPMWVLNSLQHPVIMLDEKDRISYANSAAEIFFQASLSVLARRSLDYYVPFGSPVLALLEQVRESGTLVNEYKVDVSSPRLGRGQIVDIYASPVMEEPGSTVLMFQIRSMAEKIDRQLTHRSAARSVTGLAEMLAHEIKNPLSGIRGAAQLLEASANDDDRSLTKLITEETDRIVKLVDRMEVFSDERPVERASVNVHSVLEHVKALAENGFGNNIRFVEDYDPSLPPVYANRDQLIQVCLNLVKNAAEALSDVKDPEIRFTTAFRPGIHLSVSGSSERISLPLELTITDNGPGVPENIKTHIFDPFVTSKINGSGLGLALVAKIIGDHGGVIECETADLKTVFRILLPTYKIPKSDKPEKALGAKEIADE